MKPIMLVFILVLATLVAVDALALGVMMLEG